MPFHFYKCLCSSVNSPVDEWGLSSWVIPDEHDRDLLPWRQQLKAEIISDAHLKQEQKINLHNNIGGLK